MIENLTFIKNLEFKNFRNLESQVFYPNKSFNFFHGENAQGKTSILEAIYFLVELKSFRSSDYKSLIRHGEDQLLASINLESNGLEYEIIISADESSKKILLNGKQPKPYSVLRKILPLICFTPDSVRLFRNSPGERREYFDRLLGLINPEYWTQLENYQKVLRQKSQYLEELGEGRFQDKSLYSCLNEQMALYGAAVYEFRFGLQDWLKDKIEAAFKELSGEQWTSRLVYKPYQIKIGTKSKSRSQLQLQLMEEINEREQDEKRRCQVLVGPHRDDWLYYLGDFSLKDEGSQGQHRIAVASLKLAEIEELTERGKQPIALFDDLFSELDTMRSHLMMNKLFSHSCQVFLTSIKPQEIESMPFKGSMFKIEKGRILED